MVCIIGHVCVSCTHYGHPGALSRHDMLRRCWIQGRSAAASGKQQQHTYSILSVAAFYIAVWLASTPPALFSRTRLSINDAIETSKHARLHYVRPLLKLRGSAHPLPSAKKELQTHVLERARKSNVSLLRTLDPSLLSHLVPTSAAPEASAKATFMLKRLCCEEDQASRLLG